MPRSCTICRHQDAAKIKAMLVEGVPLVLCTTGSTAIGLRNCETEDVRR
jgi:hypothetical protein